MRSMSLVLRTTLSPASATASVRAEMRRIDPDIPLAHVSTIENLVNESVAQPRGCRSRPHCLPDGMP
jgi:hypothetical protein